MKKDSKVAKMFAAKQRPTVKEAKEAAQKITGDAQRGRGRPKVDHDLKRTTIMADSEQLQELKMMAVKQGRPMYELLGDAITEYLEKNK